jgi:cytochrome b subunit of formate dehydrogenase
MKVKVKVEGSTSYRSVEDATRFQKRNEGKKEKKERLKQNTQYQEHPTPCSWWHWVFLVIFLPITGGIMTRLVKKCLS